VAFAARDGSREGLVWLDEATKRVVRFRMDVLNHPNGGKFNSFTRDVRFVPLKFAAMETPLWLPASAAVHARFATGELHSVHRFSDYHADETDDSGKTDVPGAMEEDAFEVLLNGLAALEAGEPGDAVTILRKAAAGQPERIEPGFYLGLALYKTRDLSEAETQFRETVKRSPKLAAAHDGLGAVLLARGNQPGAVAEFQKALRLEPANAKIRANLEAATRVTGDPGAPIETPPAPAAGDVTIKLNVRQVLVPVVVTDKQGHHVTGLTQSDFKVFEDGVEQKIVAFSSERADVATPVTPAGSNVAPGPPNPVVGVAKPVPPQHTFVICLDMMHTAVANSVHVREALQKLFQQEQEGNSKYVVIALGKGMEVIVDATSDPTKVLEAINGTNFGHLYMHGQKIQSRLKSRLMRKSCNEPWEGDARVLRRARPWQKRGNTVPKSSQSGNGSAPRNF